MPTPILSNQDHGGVSRIVNLPNAVDPQEPATLAQVNAAIEGLAFKDNVKSSSSSNVNLASPGATIGGITMASGDRFLARGQTTGSQNGVYIWNGASTPATRAADMNASAEFNSAVVPVDQGPDAGTQWRCTNVDPTVDTTTITFTTFGNATPAASESAAGIAEIATQAETDAGTDDLRFITALKLQNWSGRVKKAGLVIGDASATQFDLTHNFNTRDVQVTVMENSGSYRNVECDISRPNANTIRLNFAAAPALNALKVIAWG